MHHREVHLGKSEVDAAGTESAARRRRSRRAVAVAASVVGAIVAGGAAKAVFHSSDTEQPTLVSGR